MVEKLESHYQFTKDKVNEQNSIFTYVNICSY